MRNLTISATRASIGALASVMLLSTYTPAAHAESPPETPVYELVATPVDPEPPVDPCGPAGCVAVVITDCLDLVKGCEPKEPIEKPDFELCLNLDNVPCKPEIDDLLNPPYPTDPGGDGEEDGGEEDGEEEPSEPETPETPEAPETPETPEVPETPETPDPGPTPTPETPTPGGEAPTPSSETPDQADIDTPRPGNPNFTG